MRPSEFFSHVPPAACRERRCSVAGPRTFLLASCPHRRWQAQETTETEVIIGKRRKKGTRRRSNSARSASCHPMCEGAARPASGVSLAPHVSSKHAGRAARAAG